MSNESTQPDPLLEILKRLQALEDRQDFLTSTLDEVEDRIDARLAYVEADVARLQDSDY